MANWLVRIFEGWASSTQEKEFRRFINSLKGMDDDELGHVLVIATLARRQMAAEVDLLDPMNAVADDPMLPLRLNRGIGQLQKDGRTFEAAAWMVWLFTVRAVARAELRYLGKEMWRELMRGAAHVNEAATGVEIIAGVSVEPREATEIPPGLETR